MILRQVVHHHVDERPRHGARCRVADRQAHGVGLADSGQLVLCDAGVAQFVHLFQRRSDRVGRSACLDLRAHEEHTAVAAQVEPAPGTVGVAQALTQLHVEAGGEHPAEDLADALDERQFHPRTRGGAVRDDQGRLDRTGAVDDEHARQLAGGRSRLTGGALGRRRGVAEDGPAQLFEVDVGQVAHDHEGPGDRGDGVGVEARDPLGGDVCQLDRASGERGGVAAGEQLSAEAAHGQDTRGRGVEPEALQQLFAAAHHVVWVQCRTAYGVGEQVDGVAEAVRGGVQAGDEAVPVDAGDPLGSVALQGRGQGAVACWAVLEGFTGQHADAHGVEGLGGTAEGVYEADGGQLLAGDVDGDDGAASDADPLGLGKGVGRGGTDVRTGLLHALRLFLRLDGNGASAARPGWPRRPPRLPPRASQPRWRSRGRSGRRACCRRRAGARRWP